jgi:HSP20 family protein
MLDMFRFLDDRIGMPSLLGWSSMPVTVEHNDDHVLVSADLPGVDEKDVDITYERGTLFVSGRRGERQYQLTAYVGEDIDPDKIEAQLDKGVLTLRAERRPEAKPRKIALHGGDRKQLETPAA